MAPRAVALRVARDARLETLPRSLSVAEAEIAIDIMVSRLTESRRRDETRLLVTALAELRRVVAIAAIRFARVRRARVAREKLSRMVRRLSRDVGAMAIETRRADVAGLAGLRARIRLRSMTLPELRRVARRHRSRELHPRPASGTSLRHGRDRAGRWNSNVTARAALA